MCWTFIIQYGTHLFMSQGMEEKAAEVLSQEYNIIAMIIFCISRFVCTFILRYLNPGKLLAILAVAGCFFTAGVIFFQNIWGMYCLGSSLRLHVIDVPHNLRYRFDRLRR